MGGKMRNQEQRLNAVGVGGGCAVWEDGSRLERRHSIV